MIIDQRIPLTRMLKRCWKLLLFAVIYNVLIVFLHQSGHRWIDAPVAIPAMLGTVLSVLLGFRTAAAYERWWEARIIWGGIVNDSRTFGRKVLTWIGDDGGTRSSGLRTRLIHRQIAWAYSLARTLRGQDPLLDIRNQLDANEVENLREQQNVPNALLMTQGKELRRAYDDGLVNEYFLVSMEESIGRLTDHMGKCERIKNTVFPMYYSYFLSRAVFVFLLLLPSGLVHYLEWLTIPVALIIEFLFLLVERAGTALQDPFENRPSDPPIMAISRTIEINLRQQLGETELPQPILPSDGVLM